MTPFQCAISVCALPSLTAAVPAIQTSRSDVAVTVGGGSSDAGTVGLVRSVHFTPFQCSRSVTVALWVLTPGIPVAQMSHGESTSTPLSQTA
jgi:hypothetical protein